MAINSATRRLEVGDVIYKVIFDPFINDRPEWFVIPYKIKDIYYTDACYAELLMIHDPEDSVHKIILSEDNLKECFYTLDDANKYAEYLRSIPRSYAWGYNNHKETDTENNPTVGYSSDYDDHDDYNLDIIYLDDEDEKITVGEKIVNLAKRTYNKLSEKMLKIFDKVVEKV